MTDTKCSNCDCLTKAEDLLEGMCTDCEEERFYCDNCGSQESEHSLFQGICEECAEDAHTEECSACTSRVDIGELDENGYCDYCQERELEYQKENDNA